jgi:hypothetical protein
MIAQGCGFGAELRRARGLHGGSIVGADVRPNAPSGPIGRRPMGHVIEGWVSVGLRVISEPGLATWAESLVHPGFIPT